MMVAPLGAFITCPLVKQGCVLLLVVGQRTADQRATRVAAAVGLKVWQVTSKVTRNLSTRDKRTAGIEKR